MSWRSLRKRLGRRSSLIACSCQKSRTWGACASNPSCWSSGPCSTTGMSNFARERPFHRGRPSSPLCGFPPDDPLGVTVDDLGQRFDPVDAISIVRSVLQVQNARRNHNYRRPGLRQLCDDRSNRSASLGHSCPFAPKSNHHLTCCMGKTLAETPPLSRLVGHLSPLIYN